MLVCFDSSALAKLLVEEQGSDLAAYLWNEADGVPASRLVVPEVSAAIEAAARASRLSREQLRRAGAEWEVHLSELRFIELTPPLARLAADLTSRFVLGGADAVHLASALSLAPGEPVLVAWDGRLRAAGLAAGLRLAPAA